MSAPALLRRREDGRVELLSPEVGLFREGPGPGRLLQPGERLGRVERLGVLYEVHVPPGAAGAVVERVGAERTRAPVGYGERLVVLDPSAAPDAAEASIESAAAVSGLVLTAPMAGRFYARPSPGKPAFVEVGARLEEGQVVGLLEVMKTFNRVQYGGPGLPVPARVVAVLRTDDEDVDAGAPILEVEPL